MAEERVRLVVVIDEELRAALRLEAAKRDVDMADVVAELLRENLREPLEEVRRRRKADEKKRGGKE
ncbi:MAG: hypothetical protein E6Q97_09540 [Desulfurellales bacterium]|nr:MAG: hypothetical protein E6Q97_09540 [Desulfurellales bacterium]